MKPVARRRIRVYGGAVVKRDVGGAVLECGGYRAWVPVIFGEPEDALVLGATSLETLGYQVDPITKQLKPIDLLMV